MALNLHQIISVTSAKNLGIIHLFSTPYTLQQNGRVERLNRVLVEMATALLQDAKLRKNFWEKPSTVSLS